MGVDADRAPAPTVIPFETAVEALRALRYVRPYLKAPESITEFRVSELDRALAKAADALSSLGEYLRPVDDFEPVLAFSNGRRVAILGSPAEDDDSHNCDALGCSLSHVVAWVDLEEAGR